MAFLVILLAVFGAPNAAAEITDRNERLEPPRSRLGQPFEDPILLVGYGGIAGGTEDGWNIANGAVGGGFVFRPGSAVNFLRALYDWNTGLVLQADYAWLGDGDHVLSADGILRRYFADRGTENTEVRLFAGLGLGATEFSTPGAGTAVDRYWSAVGELGQEWLTRANFLVFVRGQVRYHLRPHAHYLVWSVHVGVGLGLPW